ncbi:MAG: DUF521 domain-containing protein [Candidatus Lokiarchaeota archaeon]|nr:DUF521 domain-containing protein [Candidatus Lokiarchaeota archaeon]
MQSQVLDDLKRIGAFVFTCTPFLLDNKFKFWDHCAWSESSTMIYLNSIIGDKKNLSISHPIIEKCKYFTSKQGYHSIKEDFF